MSTARATSIMVALIGLFLAVTWWATGESAPDWLYVLRSFLRLVLVVS